MQAYEVGQKLPSFFPPGYELCRSSFTPAFFDVIYWLPSYQTEHIHSWQHAHLQYGIYEAHSIPFFIFNFPAKGWRFDISLNIYSMHEDLYDLWLQRPDNSIHMILCDCFSNEVLEVRNIEIDPYITKYVRKKLAIQKENYTSAFEVQKKIEHIMDNILTEDMIKKITMHNLSQ